MLRRAAWAVLHLDSSPVGGARIPMAEGEKGALPQRRRAWGFGAAAPLFTPSPPLPLPRCSYQHRKEEVLRRPQAPQVERKPG